MRLRDIHSRITITQKVGFLLLLATCGALAAVAISSRALAHSAADFEITALAGRQRGLCEQLRLHAQGVSMGRGEDRQHLAQAIASFDQALSVLEHDGEGLRVSEPPARAEALRGVRHVRRAWQKVRPDLVILAVVPTGGERVRAAGERVQAAMPALAAASLDLLEALRLYDRRERGGTLLALLAIAGLDLLLLCVGLAVTGRYMARPLRLITEAADRVRAGDFAHRMPLAGGPELSRLGEAFNAMSDDIARLLAAVRDSEARYRILFESNPHPMWVYDLETLAFLAVNNVAIERYGYSREEFLGMTIADIRPPEDVPALLDNVSRVTEGVDEAGVWRHRKKDGRIIDVEITSHTLTFDGRRAEVVLANDVTERQRAQEELIKLRMAVQASGEVIFLTDPDGLITFVNPEFTRLYGHPANEVVGKVTPRILKSGRMADEGYAAFWRVLLNKQIVKGEIVNKTRDGRYVTVEGSANPILDRSGDIVGFLAIQRDITERKLLEEELQQAQKMEAVGRLAGGVAHDFNNILTAINAFSELGLMRVRPGDQVAGYLEGISEAGERAAALTRQLLAFSRRQVLAPEVLDLNHAVTSVGKMLQRLIGEDIELTTVLDPALGRVKADPGQIEQVILNLAVNARDAMAQGGRLVLQTANVDRDEDYAHIRPGMPPGRYVMLAVTDTGCGMDRETQVRVFEPFFTTKEQGKGTGLGLATVYGIVKQSGGDIHVYSEPGEGSVFRVYLPRVDAGGEDVEAPEATAVPGGSETILLVEDEAVVRRLARMALEERGYVVLEAACGKDALWVSEEHAGRIHLMVTDVVMPGMSGREAAECLSVLRPEMKVLFMSGYTDDAIIHHGVPQAGVPFLQKPFTPTVLARKVREVLDAS